MASPHLWTPALEPRTIINPWYRHAIINETIALDREEEEYEAQLHSIRIKEILDTSEELLPTTPPGESSRAMDVSEFEVLGTEGTEEDGQNYEF
ncbi:6490_t:CDS:2 [Funneliformis caledonium]|uniref:6490_t:CDS:1 n=1 Tax=Funneliformis caledonium TaxID=1117310 RepID=A0A9N9HAG9_9GLOM|nr:6490_t:CDS:2 [Funneliformis caledonium]